MKTPQIPPLQGMTALGFTEPVKPYYSTTYAPPKGKPFYTITERATGKVVFTSADCETIIEAELLASEHIDALIKVTTRHPVK